MSGIYITKSGQALPVVSEMSLSAFNAFEANKTLALIKNTNHVFNVFEGYRFRTRLDELASAVVTMNGATNYTANFPTGTGSFDGTTGTATPLSVGAVVEELNRIYINATGLTPSMGVGSVNGQQLTLQILSLNLLSKFEGNQLGIWSHIKNGVANTNGDAVVANSSALSMRVNSGGNLEFLENAIILTTIPLTWRGIASASAGVMLSSGAVTGSWVAMHTSDTFDSVDVVGNGTLTVESFFGQSTIYTTKLGTAITPTGGLTVRTVNFANQSAESYNAAADFTGGVGVIAYSISTGQIPSGMSLNSIGQVVGIPTAEGSYTVTIKALDEFGGSVEVQYIFNVAPSTNVSYQPQSSYVGVPYLYNPNINGVSLVVLDTGAIPTGLVLNGTTGVLTGTPTAAGTYTYALKITVTQNGVSGVEQVNVETIIYTAIAIQLQSSDKPSSILTGQSGQSQTSTLSEQLNLVVTGGSGNYQFGIDNGNVITSDGNITFGRSGATTVTVTDNITGQIFTYLFFVEGQGGVCAYGIEDIKVEFHLPCADVLTDCNTPVTIGFAGMQIQKGFGENELPHREYVNFVDAGGTGQIVQSGNPFGYFKSTIANAWAIADNLKDGKDFLLTMALDGSLANAALDAVVGVASKFIDKTLGGFKYSLAITSVSGNRYAELRKDNVYVNGSRFQVGNGEEVGFGIIDNSVILYVNNILRYTLSNVSIGCAGMELAFFAQQPNMIFGGRAMYLTYAIATEGTANTVGTINAQTGIYTPSNENIGAVEIHATSSAYPDILYSTKVRVIRPAMVESFNQARIEGVPVEVWIAGGGRKDDKPTRLNNEGMPDQNQFFDIQHIGTLQGAGKIDAPPIRQDFTNDKGATSSSMRIDKVTFTGGFLNVRNMSLMKRLIPFMKDLSAHGGRGLRQFSTGCRPKIRLIMIWRNPSCDDTDVFDLIEIHNALSYTAFSFEVGQQVQTQIPLTIEGFPTDEGFIFDYWQFDGGYHRIGE